MGRPIDGVPALLPPQPDAATQPFWDACREGRFLVKRCRACARAHFYPRTFCPHCWSGDVAWEEATGRGTLYTWSVVHQNELPPFRDHLPYVAAIVELEEGPRVMTVIVGADPGDLAGDAPVRVRFTTGPDGFTFPTFELA